MALHRRDRWQGGLSCLWATAPQTSPRAGLLTQSPLLNRSRRSHSRRLFQRLEGCGARVGEQHALLPPSSWKYFNQSLLHNKPLPKRKGVYQDKKWTKSDSRTRPRSWRPGSIAACFPMAAMGQGTPSIHQLCSAAVASRSPCCRAVCFQSLLVNGGCCRSEWKVTGKGRDGPVWELDWTGWHFLQEEKTQNGGRDCSLYLQDYLPEIYHHAQLWSLHRSTSGVSCSHVPHSATSNFLPAKAAARRCWNAAFYHSAARRRAPSPCPVTAGWPTDPSVQAEPAAPSPGRAGSRPRQESGQLPCASSVPRVTRAGAHSQSSRHLTLGMEGKITLC